MEFIDFSIFNSKITREKKKCQKEIWKHRMIIQEYEQLTKSAQQDQRMQLKEEEFIFYESQSNLLQEKMCYLYQLRLEGGCFLSIISSRFKSSFDLSRFSNASASKYSVLWISPMGRLFFIDYKTFIERSDDFLLAIKKGNDIFQNLSLEFPFNDVDQIKSIHLHYGNNDDSSDYSENSPEEDNSDGLISQKDDYSSLQLDPGIIRIEWKHKNPSYIVVAESKEFIEVLGSHLKHFNHKKYLTIIRIKELYKMKSSNFFTLFTNQMNSIELDDYQTYESGFKLLHRLWNASFENTKSASEWTGDFSQYKNLFKNEKWRSIGFQNDFPSTDFRGMGYLGLWCLTYLAEKSAGYPRSSLFTLPRERSQTEIYEYASSSFRIGWVQEISVSSSSLDIYYSAEERKDKRVRQYPWAAAGINVISMIFHTFLGLNDDLIKMSASHQCWDSIFLNFLSHLEPTSAIDTNLSISSPLRNLSFIGSASVLNDLKNSQSELLRTRYELTCVEEFFCFAMELLDRMYIRTGAAYMDFPIVMKRVESKLKEWLGISSKGSDKFKSITNATTSISNLNSTISFSGQFKPLSMEELWERLDKELSLE